MKLLNEKYGAGTVELTLRDQYANMAEVVQKHFHLIDRARAAAEQAELLPRVLPIRGGTDGARLSWMGLPCPNLGTGGFAFHGPYEHITVQGMEQVVAMLHNLVRRTPSRFEREKEKKQWMYCGNYRRFGPSTPGGTAGAGRRRPGPDSPGHAGGDQARRERSELSDPGAALQLRQRPDRGGGGAGNFPELPARQRTPGGPGGGQCL